MAVATWLNPPNFLQAMHSGAQLGLQRAAQADEAAQAADKLRLGYASLAAQERESAQRYQVEREKSQAELMLRGLTAQQLDKYRQDEIAVKQQEEERRVAEAQSKHDYFQGKLKLGQDKLASDAVKKTRYHIGNSLVEAGPDGTVNELYTAPGAVKATPEQRDAASILTSRIKDLERRVADPKEDEKVKIEQYGPALNDARQQLQTIYRKPAAAAPTAPTQSLGLPKVGDVINGHRFKGGDPSVPDNWEILPNHSEE